MRMPNAFAQAALKSFDAALLPRFHKITVDSTEGFDVGSFVSLGRPSRWQRIKMFFGLWREESYKIVGTTGNTITLISNRPKPNMVQRIVAWSVMPTSSNDTVTFRRPVDYVSKSIP
jgi:hypothetical protein